ncbi:hypothetical protein BH11VER1_BH11VER1_09830 [soil metagenome]
MDWTDWHKQYEDSLVLLARLRIVREQIRATLDECGTGPIRIVSICAGDGRDVIEALSGHPRRSDVTAWLLDTHEPSLERGRAAAAAAALEAQVQFLCADATLAENYRGIVPADLIIISGVLGHQSNAGILRFLENLSMLCKSGGSVIWNRHLVTNEGTKSVLQIRENLGRNGFKEVHYEVTSRNGTAVGRSRFGGEVAPFDPERKIFEFLGLDYMTYPHLRSGAPVPWEMDENNQPGGGRASLRLQGHLDDNFRKAPNPADVEQSLPACFERQAILDPAKKALGSGTWQPTYKELNGAANCLAHTLITRGASTGDRVALLMHHDTPLIAAMLAVLKAGTIVVTLNPTDPPVRLGQVLQDAEPFMILTDRAHHELAAQIAATSCKVLCVEDHILGETTSNPDIRISPNDTAFLVYTSGTTGRPKGVMQSHRHILHKAHRISHGLGVQADKVVLLASLSGGQGVNTTWCTLAHGATLCPFSIMTKGVTGLADWMAAHGITVYASAASVFRLFVGTLESTRCFDDVRLVWLLSESTTSEDFAFFQKHFGPGAVLLHTLSSSETGIFADICLKRNDSIPMGRLPVGRPVAEVEVLLLDENGHEVPAGEAGEIAVRSSYLSTGYWRNDSLTARHFSRRSESDCALTFRGGDRGRFTADGLLIYLGRNDARAKIHGYRVELTEVEDALAHELSVDRAVVCASEARRGEMQLTAYVTVRPGHTCSSRLLREALRGTLPGHMIPTAFVFIESIPLTPHGKVDREALRKILAPTEATPGDDEPETDTEKILAAIWSDVFERNPIGRQDDFFDLGGDSLAASVIVARLDAALGVPLDLRAFAEHPTLAALAASVDARRTASGPETVRAIGRASRDEPLPLSFNQERVWKYSQTPEGSAGYSVASRMRIQGPLDVTALSDSISHIIRRHEILRTTFVEKEGRPVQIVHPAEISPVRLMDFSGAPDAEKQADEFYRSECARPLHLADGPLAHFALVRISEGEHRFYLWIHHILSDEWSSRNFFRELGLLYEAYIDHREPPLPESMPLQYGDYAAWQREHLRPDGPNYQQAITWWKEFLDGGPSPLEFPFKRPELLKDVAPAEGVIFWGVDPVTSSRLDKLARDEGVTFFVLRLAAMLAVLSDTTGQRDVVLGTYATNRQRVEFHELYGFFANLITMRFRCDLALTFREHLRNVNRAFSGAQARAEIPYEQLCEELRKSGSNPPEIRMIFRTSDRAPFIRFGGLELTRIDWRAQLKARMPWGFSLDFDKSDVEHGCCAFFDANLYDPTGVHDLIQRLCRFLDAAGLQPDLSMAESLLGNLPIKE